MIKFCFVSLINFSFILSLGYIETFVLNSYYQLSDDISPYKMIFLTLSMIVIVLPYHLIYDRNFNILGIQGNNKIY